MFQEKTRAVRELTATVLSRLPKMCNFIEWQDKKVIYKRYASLYFVACVDKDDNELIVLEQIQSVNSRENRDNINAFRAIFPDTWRLTWSDHNLDK